MRSNRVPQFPAPDGQGDFNNAQIQNIDDNDQPAARNANFACRSLLPNEGTGLTVTQLQGMLQQNLRNAVKGASCMRAHGVANFPDPAATTGASGVNWGPVVSAMQAGEFSTSTASYETALKACNGKLDDHIIPPGLGLSPVVSGSPAP
jgi:hypothetical protein